MVVSLRTWERTPHGRRVASAVEHPTAFGARLRELRTRAGLSQNALATAAGVNSAYVNRLERGSVDVHPSRAVVCRLWLVACGEPDDLDALLYAAGLVPQAIVDAGGWADFLAGWQGSLRAVERKLELARADHRRICRDVVALRRGSAHVR